MIRVKNIEMDNIAGFFDGINDAVVFSCLQGNMGNAYVKSWDDPKAAMIINGDYGYFGGDAFSEDAEYLIKGFFDVGDCTECTIIFSQEHLEWVEAFMACPENNPWIKPRYGIVYKDYDFDMERIQSYIDALPQGYVMKRIDAELYEQALSEDWSKEFCDCYPSADDYMQRGFGFAAVKDGKMVSGASTMAVFDMGVELTTATREDHKRRGLALPCCAAMVKECVGRGIRPCWDAANLISKKMALKLGYEYEGEYTTIGMRR